MNFGTTVAFVFIEICHYFSLSFGNFVYIEFYVCQRYTNVPINAYLPGSYYNLLLLKNRLHLI